MGISPYVKNIRKKIGSDMLQIATADWHIIDGNNILLQQRSPEKIWGMVGGLIEPGEEVANAAKRELKEETGLTALEYELFGIYSGPYKQHTYPNGDKISPVSIVFITTKVQGKLEADDEGEDLQWFSIEKLPKNLHLSHLPLINDCIDYINGKQQLPILKS